MFSVFLTGKDFHTDISFKQSHVLFQGWSFLYIAGRFFTHTKLATIS